MTLAQTLIEIKAAKPKAITTVATIPKAKRIVFHDQEEQAPAFTPIVSSSQASNLPQAKDIGKAKMVEPENPLKKKDQIALNEELALRMHAEEQANIQAMIESDELLAARLQADKQEQFSIKEKSRMLVEMIAERKKFFAAQRAAEQRNEHVEAKKDDDREEAEMKKHIEIVKDDEVAIDAIPLATKPPVIFEYKIVKEGKFRYFQLIRADGSTYQ
ncbi:hypothetical protein Tco_1527611 [Tanacetum coccineum]